ncbi:exo-beta-N-acetylmuramidase NamZ family protein [Botrimarina hoheduenensis]|uniref:DUF1343 domain-containing protein n=1 Tax=Botrimarina hoheduenensis TaxID=2528000 RepID=A0A5C5VWD3_9BACT|nr:DUF1343 domain-containing protein [Botrimarina hoheduenensis]TWT42680.1 hypothetical protein Pla111_26530 [Botrimarina hoheduenensis]
MRLLVPSFIRLMASCRVVLAAAALSAAAPSAVAPLAIASEAAVVSEAKQPPVAERVVLGIDVLQREDYRLLRGKRVGLITNHTGLDSAGHSTADLFHNAEQVELVRLFGPEHGIRGELDQAQIADGVDEPTGLPVVSLYGPRRQPEPEHLAGLDVLVFDIQDIGCRFYTYISTMKLAMEAASQAGIDFVVLDRPNPIDGVTIEGPMLDADAESFVACHSLPLRHGMTTGELAQLIVADAQAAGPTENPLANVKLTVVRCEGWRRNETWEATGLVWTDPSPNMRRLSQALLYPGVGFLETTNVSVGRGTDTPFERFGAPWIDPAEFAAALNAEQTPGVRFVPRWFTPTSSKFAGERCGGVDLILIDTPSLDAVQGGLAMARTLALLYPNEWEHASLKRLLACETLHQAIVRGAPLDELCRISREGLDAFAARRQRALLYP